jgi:lipoprotein-anchoring transpeptidase ErfK/SrfK
MTQPTVTVRKTERSLELATDAGVERFTIAIGSNPDGADKLAVGDCRTPEGEFEIVSIEESGDWEHEGERVYGPYFLRLHCPPWEGIGIHGTSEPDSLGTKATRGCVRMRNEDVTRLASLVEVGTLVRILP